MEPIHINPSASLLGCIVEDSELAAHEMTSVVEDHLDVASDVLPVGAVGAVGKRSEVASVVEVSMQPEIDELLRLLGVSCLGLL